MTSAIVLSAGFGTRLRPLTDELAKPLMPVGDRSMIAHVVETLGRGGIRDVVVNTHHRAEDFVGRFDGWDANIRVVHESEILGTAGGVANASAELGASDVVVWNGDILAPDLDVGALTNRRAATGGDVIWVVEPRAAGEGTVGLDVEGHVVRLRDERFGDEARGGDFLGIQVMSATFRATLPRIGCLVADVALPFLRRGGTIGSFAFQGFWDDVGTPDMLLRANLRWLERHELASYRAADARVEAGVRLERSIVGTGGAVVGDGIVRECVVFPGAVLRAPAVRTVAGRVAAVTLADPAATTR
jgi:mannose-1-phosphate guanylyltransferase